MRDLHDCCQLGSSDNLWIDWLAVPLGRNMHKYQSRSADLQEYTRINNGLMNEPIQGVIGLPWFSYIACRDLRGDKPIAKNNKYSQRRYELVQFIDYLQNTYCNMHAAFLHHLPCTISYSQPIFADRNVHSFFQEKFLWSTNPTPLITDDFDRTYMVVVMQLNEYHELPVTHSDIGSPHMGEGSTCLHAGSKRRGCEPFVA
jgi:hypothetical protein